MKTSVFLDYDGTLAGAGGISAANREAIAEARRRGALVFIATGRPKCMMPGDSLDIVDGFVGSAGAYVEIDGEVLVDEGIPADTAHHLAQRLEADGAVWSYDSAEAIWASPRSAQQLRAWHDSDHGLDFDVADILRHLREVDLLGAPAETLPVVTKAVVWMSDVSVFKTVEAYTDVLDALPASVPGMDGMGGELYLRHLSKATGMHRVLEHLGLDVAASIAVGDSHNDIPLLREAGRAFAVRGAPQVLRDLAEADVAPPADGGVGEALRLAGVL